MASVFPTKQVIVVGGGLGGMSAANTVLENGGAVVLLDKSSFCGGNSTKATSGINGAGTRTQKNKGIEDSKELFTNDTLKGGAKKPELVKVLCENSGADVEWLMDKFDLDLSLVARLGGHSAPRTHRGAERFPGMTITYALIQMVETIAEKFDIARIITKANVVKLVCDNGKCVGCTYEKGGSEFQEFGPVILASGGFGADFTSSSLLAQYRPDLLHLPTTNGEHCTGDGIKMGEAIGAKSIDLEWVQVHPTGLVKPDDADAKIKFLAAEALRGVGGIILDADGNRFANELGRRDYVTGEMWKNKPPFRLALNKAASDEISWHCKHYTGRGVMKFYASGEEFAKDMGVPLSTIVKSHDDHYEAAKKTEKDPNGGSWPAYPSGKSWDEASGKTGSGKKFYHNIIPGSAVKTEPFYVAIITPVIHYCMGGLLIDTDSNCVREEGKPIPGLYAAGEVAGGVHGNNRLGGNSLLDCVVFGRVAGKAATKFILGDDMHAVDIKELSKEKGTKAPPAPAATPAAPAPATKEAAPIERPGWEKAYNEKLWKERKHVRKYTVGLYKKCQDAHPLQSLNHWIEHKLGLDKGDPEAPLAVAYRDPSSVTSLHYFPLPDEKGANGLIPGFRVNKNTHVIVYEFCKEGWDSISPLAKKKALFAMVVFFCVVLSKIVVRMTALHPW
jgi:flavocytochrome c